MAAPTKPSIPRDRICGANGVYFMDMTALFLSRLQFAFTVSFHIIFPSFTIGLAAWLTVLEASHLATGRSLAVSFLALHDSLCDHHRPSRCGPFQPGVHVLGRRSLRIPSHAGLHGDQLSRLSGARLGQPPTTTSGSPQRRERIHGVDGRQCMPDGLVPDCCVMIAQLPPDKMPPPRPEAMLPSIVGGPERRARACFQNHRSGVEESSDQTMGPRNSAFRPVAVVR